MIAGCERLIGGGSPFELISTEWQGVPCRLYRHGPATLKDIYQRARRGDAQELLLFGDDRFTNSMLFTCAEHVAAVLAGEFRVGSGVRVALVLDNCPEWVVGLVAITSLGATAVLIHKSAPADELLAALELADCALLVCDDEVATVLLARGSRRPIVLVRTAAREVNGAFVVPFLVAGARGAMPHTDVRPEQLAMIAFTSGSTGQPKGVELTHRSLTHGLMNMLLGGALAALSSRSSAKSRPSVRPLSLIVSSFSHVAGFANVLLGMYLGGRIATLRSWDATLALRIIRAAPAVSLVGPTAAMVRDLLEVCGTDQEVQSLGSVMVQGTALPSTLIAEVKRSFPNITIGTGYGMTETCGSVSVCSAAMLEERPASSGQPLPSLELSVRHTDGSAASTGENGEIFVRGAMLMRGYCNSPEITAKVLQDGWLRTGDIGRLDGDGFLYVSDRMTNVLVCNGVEVSCAAVENVILRDNLAHEVAAFGLESAAGGDRLVVVVGHYSADKVRIIRALESAGYAGADIVQLGSLPRTVSGKVDRREARRQVLADISDLV